MPDLVSKFVWKLARRHSWGAPIPEEQLVRLAAGHEDHDEAGRVLEEEVLDLPFVVRSAEGIHIPNGRDAHVRAANWLRERTELDEFKIRATLSRLPDSWPREQ
ncbi:MAG: hypothetical protein ABEH35_06795 [Haloarculaceae archaeon]